MTVWTDISNPPYSPETSQALEQRSTTESRVHPCRGEIARDRLCRKRCAHTVDCSTGVATMTTRYDPHDFETSFGGRKATRKRRARDRRRYNKVRRLKRTAAGRERIRRRAMSDSLDFRSACLRARPVRVSVAGGVGYTVEICMDDSSAAQARMITRQIPGARLISGGRGGVLLPARLKNFTITGGFSV